jgi:predicted phosphoribosyltransferase
MRFRDRTDAGKQLAEKLSSYRDVEDLLVLGLPRGGVPVASEVARELDAPLDVYIVRKLGVPGHEELAFGAIASGGTRVLNRDVVDSLGITGETIEQVAEREQKELLRREEHYRGERQPPAVSGRTVVVVDDGLATGASMRAAVKALREQGAGRIVAGVPTAAPDTAESMKELADDVVCVMKPAGFGGVGAWYEDFSQTTDEEVTELLARAQT